MEFELLNKSFVKGKCIIVPVLLHDFTSGYSASPQIANFILDTGATTTHISRRLLSRKGYKETMFTKDTKKSLSSEGSYTATLCKVCKFSFCDIAFANHTVKVWETPKDHHVDGFIGMDILQHFNININMDTRRTVITQSNSTKALLSK